jgi:hypothetical protein
LHFITGLGKVKEVNKTIGGLVMVKVVKDYTPEEVQATKGVRGTPKDELLAPYKLIIEPVAIGAAREVELEAGDSRQATKRRMTLAAQQLDKKIIWRDATDKVNHLRFEVVDPNIPKQKRGPRKSKA